MLHEVLERGQCPWADPLQLVGDERLEQPPERAASQDDLGLTGQQGLIALWLQAPFVPRASQERNPHTLVGEGMPLVPDEPTLADRDTPAEIAGSLGADTLEGAPSQRASRTASDQSRISSSLARRAQTTSAGASIHADANSLIVRTASQSAWAAEGRLVESCGPSGSQDATSRCGARRADPSPSSKLKLARASARSRSLAHAARARAPARALASVPLGHETTPLHTPRAAASHPIAIRPERFLTGITPQPEHLTLLQHSSPR